MPGPLPNPNARRRNARPTAIRLPASGRDGEPPDWPLSKATKAEQELWRQLWSSPQAVAWEELGWVRTVARYARFTVKAERPRASAFLLSEVRQLEDRIGLTPYAMKRLGWEVVEMVIEASRDDAKIADLDEFRERLA